MGESMNLLSVDTPPHLQIDWITAESMSEGLKTLLVTLWNKSQPLVSNLLYMIHHNYKERRTHGLGGRIYAHVFFHRLSLDLKTWCISVEKEAEDINILRIYSL